jgi:alpha-N-arabinofuranosidase
MDERSAMNAIKIDAERVLGHVEPHLLGQIVEHYGSLVYGGLVDERTGAPRGDTLRALREVGVPLLRWPGGNFASGYHWQDGVGPRERRPVRFDLEWQAEEPNTFGTDEYIATCRALGATPYICANAGSGTAEEAARWVEYCNREGRSTFAALRAANGNSPPHGVPLWGIGNEVYGRGQIGRADVDDYIGTVKEFSRLMKKVDPTIRLVAVGWERAEWNFRLVKEAGEYFDYLALHSYHPRPASFAEAMALPLVTAEQIRETLGAIDSASYYVKDRRGSPIRIAMDEWNLREWDHERFIEWLSLAYAYNPANPELVARGSTLARETRPPDPARMPAFIAERRKGDDDDAAITLTDGLYAACIIHEMLRTGGRIALGCFAPLINGKGLIGCRGGALVCRPTGLVFQLLGPHHAGAVVDCFVRCGGSELFVRSDAQNFRRRVSVPRLDAVATLSTASRRLCVSVVNRGESDEEPCQIRLDAFSPKRLRRAVLSAETVDRANTAADPQAVRVTWSEHELSGSPREETFAPHSCTLLVYER